MAAALTFDAIEAVALDEISLEGSDGMIVLFFKNYYLNPKLSQTDRHNCQTRLLTAYIVATSRECHVRDARCTRSECDMEVSASTRTCRRPFSRRC